MTRHAPSVDDPQKAGFVCALLCEFLGDYGEEKAVFSDAELAAVRRIAACCRAAIGGGAGGDAPELLADFLAWRQGPDATTAAGVASLLAALQTLRTAWRADAAQQREFAAAMLALWRGGGRMTKAERAMAPLVFGTLGVPPATAETASLGWSPLPCETGPWPLYDRHAGREFSSPRICWGSGDVL